MAAAGHSKVATTSRGPSDACAAAVAVRQRAPPSVERRAAAAARPHRILSSLDQIEEHGLAHQGEGELRPCRMCFCDAPLFKTMAGIDGYVDGTSTDTSPMVITEPWSSFTAVTSSVASRASISSVLTTVPIL